VGKEINNNHQELRNYRLNKKNKQVMAAASGHTGIRISYQQVYSAEYRSDWPDQPGAISICGACSGA
jgi:hypothetical protein